MPDRKRLIAGNWKMNGLRADGLGLAAELAKRAKSSRLACDLLVCPPATLLVLVGDVLQGSGIALGGQDCHAAPKGAFTGSLSASFWFFFSRRCRTIHRCSIGLPIGAL